MGEAILRCGVTSADYITVSILPNKVLAGIFSCLTSSIGEAVLQNRVMEHFRKH